MQKPRPTLFISYSWDGQQHQKWVLQLADDLMAQYGVIVLLDQYELRAGRELTFFMESSIQRADKVLLILTPNYKLKAEGRQGGVGYETSMISTGIYNAQVGNDKFIPVLREGDSASASPSYIQGRIYHDMRDARHYISQLYELAQLIYDESQREKPALGPIPDFKSKSFDPLLAELQEIKDQQHQKQQLDDVLHSDKGVALLKQEVNQLHHLIEAKVNSYNAVMPSHFAFHRDRGTNMELLGAHLSFYYAFNQRYKNTTSDSELIITQSSTRNAYQGFSNRLPPGSSQQTWTFTLHDDGSPLWKAEGQSETATSQQLVDRAFTKMIDKLRAEGNR